LGHWRHFGVGSSSSLAGQAIGRHAGLPFWFALFCHYFSAAWPSAEWLRDIRSAPASELAAKLVETLWQRYSQLMAPNGHADPIERCPLLGPKRKTSARSEYFAFLTLLGQSAANFAVMQNTSLNSETW
jgi:hypothetical protein